MYLSQFELLAPGGDVESIKAAILAGADAVYCGLNKFNARNRASNITFDELPCLLRLAHDNNCKLFLTLNIIIVESEFKDLIRLLNKLVNTSIDGVIVQDLGVMYLLKKYFPTIEIHASTQLTTHNMGQIKFFKKLGTHRINLSRELNIDEVTHLTHIAHANDVETEVFVHGSNCISFSGLCYISSVFSGNSGNRGRCSQQCRAQFDTTSVGCSFPLNLKDNCALSILQELAEAEVDSLKIEGRIKKYDYVYSVVNAWHNELNRFYRSQPVRSVNKTLYRVFNRGLTNGYLEGEIGRDMFIDNPRDNSAIKLATERSDASKCGLDKARDDINYEREIVIKSVSSKLDEMATTKIPLNIEISGNSGELLSVIVQSDNHIIIQSDIALRCNTSSDDKRSLTREVLLSRLKVINETEYFIESLNLDKLGEGLYLPFNEITKVKKRLFYALNGRSFIDSVEIPRLENVAPPVTKKLSILISSKQDVAFCEEIDNDVDIYYQIPNCIGNSLNELIELFINNKRLKPWFPAVLIGEHFKTAVELLIRVNPSLVITNNTGIAFEAFEHGIKWVAGPNINVVNSYSLICLNNNLSCYGAFISNEISRNQIGSIKRPANFHVFYSLYHPIELMISRQCLFQQVTGCDKNKIDEACLYECNKLESLDYKGGERVYIEKSTGNYNHIYSEKNFLNTKIVTDIPHLFTDFFIDLRDVENMTNIITDKVKFVKQFKRHINGDPNVAQEIEETVGQTSDRQYKKGI